METGVVKRVKEGRNYCFIARDEGGADLYANFSEVQGEGVKTLAENQRVEFEVGDGTKGPQAKSIRIITDPDSAAPAA